MHLLNNDAMSSSSFSLIRNKHALAGVAQWTERWPGNQSVACSIPSQGTCLGCRPGPQLGVSDGQPHMDVSLPLSLPLSLKINK